VQQEVRPSLARLTAITATWPRARSRLVRAWSSRRECADRRQAPV